MRVAIVLFAAFVAVGCMTVHATRVVCRDGEQQVVQKIKKFDETQYVSEPIDQTCIDGQWETPEDPTSDEPAAVHTSYR